MISPCSYSMRDVEDHKQFFEPHQCMHSYIPKRDSNAKPEMSTVEAFHGYIRHAPSLRTTRPYQVAVAVALFK
jgi:hypothetical protein